MTKYICKQCGKTVDVEGTEVPTCDVCNIPMVLVEETPVEAKAEEPKAEVEEKSEDVASEAPAQEPAPEATTEEKAEETAPTA